MALSDKVRDSLKEAEGQLRNALAFAARNEKPIVCSTLTKILLDVESIAAYDKVADKLEELGEDDPFKNYGGLL
jgi:hypothetical protein